MNILDIPSTTKKESDINPWQFTLFKTLASCEGGSYLIQIEDLFEAYERVMLLCGLTPISRSSLISLLSNLPLSHTYAKNNVIALQDYTTTLIKYISINQHYSTNHETSYPISLTLKTIYINWQKYGLFAITTTFDMIAVIILMLGKMSFPPFLIMARVSAIIILTNTMFILFSLTNISIIVPDKILATAFPSEYSHFYHKVFGIKVFIGILFHCIGHFVHVHNAIQTCKSGCTRETIKIVHPSQSQIVISYQYFMLQFAYLSGIVLLAIFGAQLMFLILYNKKLIRYSTNQLAHKLLALLGFVFIIVHGVTELIGFNFSYIFVLPFVLSYCWNRRHDVFGKAITIERWTITKKTIFLYFPKSSKLENTLKAFNTVTVYINCPSISWFEWHPFTLSRNYFGMDAVLSINRRGVWTNKLANALMNNPLSHTSINIGHYTRSKFRFHCLYKIRYFFCAGIGITAFISTMIDTLIKKLEHSTHTVLVWSVSDTDIVKAFSDQLNDLSKKVINLKIHTYYSNGSRPKGVLLSQTKERFTYLQYIIFGYSGIDIVTGVSHPICLNMQRANFVDILSKAVVSNKHKCDQIGVFICGPPRYASNLLTVIDMLNRNEHCIILKAWSEAA